MTAWLAETLAGSTLLMLLVLALRRPVARIFGALWAYALWLIPAVRLILPPLPDLFPNAPLPPVVIFIPTTADLAAPQPAMSANWEWMPLIVALWAGGAVIFLTLQWLDYREFLHRLAVSARPARPPSYGGISILVSPEVDGPIALGLLHRKIIVPADFLRRYSPAERRLAMEHELIHHRRGDMWWNLAALVVLALNWFNPVAWFAFGAFRSDQELACDAAVAARASLDERHDYASALVKSASRPGLIAACPLTRIGQLKHRLRMMRSHRITCWRSAGGASAIAALASGAFVLGTPGFNHQPERHVVYLRAPTPAPDSAPLRVASAAASAVRSWASAASRHHRLSAAVRHPAASRPADPDLLALASATVPNLPDVEMPTLKPLAGIRTERTVRILRPAGFTVHTYHAATWSGGEPEIRQNLETLSRLLSDLGGELDESDLQTLRTAIDQMHGRLKIKVLKADIRENGA